jgi:hypothetical protein
MSCETAFVVQLDLAGKGLNKQVFLFQTVKYDDLSRRRMALIKNQAQNGRYRA